MTVHQLLLASGARVRLKDDSASFGTTAPTDAHAGYRLNSSGSIDKNQASSLTWLIAGGIWLLSGVNSDYEVRATLNSGTVNGTSAVTGSWLVLSTTRQWECAELGTGNVSADLTVEIRDAVSLAVLASAHVVLSADVS